MAKIALIGDATTDGGALTTNPTCHVTVGNVAVALDQCHVTSHLPGTPKAQKHIDPDVNVVTASGKVTIKGTKVVMHGDAAACGATVVATSKLSTG
jgi:uncharacterized Zn-binding protein involved in type VI secretion